MEKSNNVVNLKDQKAARVAAYKKLHDTYVEMQEAGFTKSEAMAILSGMFKAYAEGEKNAKS